MSKEIWKKRIAIMQAWIDGKVIQNAVPGGSHWVDLFMDPSWSWETNDYRVKPEEKYVAFNGFQPSLLNKKIITCKDGYRGYLAGCIRTIKGITDKGVYLSESNFADTSLVYGLEETYQDLVNRWTFYDTGKPVGRLVE